MLDGWEVRSYEKILSCPKPHTTQAEGFHKHKWSNWVCLENDFEVWSEVKNRNIEWFLEQVYGSFHIL